MRPLLPTPARAIVDGRVAAYGLFDTPFRTLNLTDCAVPGIPSRLRRFRLKEWQHFAIVTPELFMGVVISTSHYLGLSFCYVVDLATGELTERHVESGPWAAQVPETLWHADARFKMGDYQLHFENRLDGGYHHLHVDIGGRRGTPIHAELRLGQCLPKVQPLVIMQPVSENRPLYTHKAPIPVSGTIRAGDRTYDVSDASALALMDIQKTYYPYRTEWRWATFAGYDTQGRMLALNLVRNMLPNQDENENVLWVDGALTPLSAATFDFDPQRILEPWHITTTDGLCDVTLRPLTQRVGRVNTGLILTDYRAPIGRFSGTLTDRSGETYAFEDLVGIAEHHVARF